MPTAKQLANLKPPINQRPDQREIRSKGGKKSGEIRRNLKEIREWAEQNLFTEKGKDKIPLYKLLFQKLETLCDQGNLRAIEMFLNYSGLKPLDEKEKIVVVNNNNLDINKLKELKNKLE